MKVISCDRCGVVTNGTDGKNRTTEIKVTGSLNYTFYLCIECLIKLDKFTTLEDGSLS